MNRPPAPILVASDASDDAHAAMRVAAWLAQRSGAPLHLVHVWQMPFTYGIPAPLLLSPDLASEAGAAVLNEERALAEGFGVPVAGAHLQDGPPVPAILAVAGAVEAGMMVVGRRGLGPVGRVVLGSVSDGIVRNCQVPALVVHGSTWPPARLVVGDDGSDEAGDAVEAAADLAAVTGAPYQVQHTTAQQTGGLDDAALDCTALLVVGVPRSPDGHRLHRHGVAERVLHHAAGSVLVVPAAPVHMHSAAGAI